MLSLPLPFFPPRKDEESRGSDVFRKPLNPAGKWKINHQRHGLKRPDSVNPSLLADCTLYSCRAETSYLIIFYYTPVN